MFKIIQKISEFLTDNFLFFKKFFVIFVLVFSFCFTSAQAIPIKYYANNKTDTTAFKYRSTQRVSSTFSTDFYTQPYSIQAPTQDDVSSYVWTNVVLPSVNNITSVNFKFEVASLDDYYTFNYPATFLCPVEDAYNDMFHIWFIPMADFADGNSLHDVAYTVDNSGMNGYIATDGTCALRFTDGNGDNISSVVGGSYAMIVSFNGYGTPSTDPYGTPIYILGSNNPAHDFIWWDKFDTNAIYNYIVDGSAYYNGENRLTAPDFYFTKTDSVVSPPASTFDLSSCNPFSGDIMTAFLNTDFSLSTCLGGIFQYLFIPSNASLTQYQGLYNEVIQKPPFGYVVAINGALTGINDTNTSAFTLTSMPILNTYIFDPIRTGLIWVLWVAFAFILFHRLKNIDL